MGKFEGAAGERATRLESLVKEGDAYGALQSYKTFHARSAKKGQFAVAVDLLRSGSVVLLENNHLTAGTELALLLVETLETGKIEQTDEVSGLLMEVTNAFDKVENKSEAAKNQGRFLKACIDWSTLKKFGRYEKGDPNFHLAAAKAKMRTGDLPGACTHFLHAKQPQQLAAFLFQWSAQGYQSERDMFVARTVLQLLALQNLKDANIVLENFTALCAHKNTPLKETPLTNFIRMLLKTVERDAYPLFKMLCEKYQTSINRDQTFQLYLDRISEGYFGVKPQKRGMQAMLDSMLGMFAR